LTILEQRGQLLFLYTVNPYFLLKENGNQNNEDRVYGNFDLDYALTKHLSAK